MISDRMDFRRTLFFLITLMIIINDITVLLLLDGYDKCDDGNLYSLQKQSYHFPFAVEAFTTTTQIFFGHHHNQNYKRNVSDGGHITNKFLNDILRKVKINYNSDIYRSRCNCNKIYSTSVLLQNDIKIHDHSVTIAGTLWPVIQKLHINRKEMTEIFHNIQSVTEWQEIIILPFIAFAFHPIIRYIFHRKKQQLETDNNNVESYKQNEFSWFNISLRIGQIGQVALTVYLMDVVSVVLTTIGMKFPNEIQLSTTYMKIAYTTLFISRLLLYKKVALCKLFDVKPDDMGQVDILNRFLNGIIVTIGTLLVFDWLSVRMGKAMKGIFALGSIGTLAFTLASKNLVTEILSGIVLMFGNKMNVGDKVKFGDGSPCTVVNIGWLETLVRGSDNIETRVPNAKLASQKVSNISRTRISQVKQTLRFRYQDADKIPQLITDMKKEIIAACPKLILNRFGVYWTDFKEDHLEVMIDTHHNIAPSSDEYWMNRQELLSAILRAVEKNNVELQHDSIMIYLRKLNNLMLQYNMSA